MKLLYAQSNIDEIVNRENFASFSYECFDNSRIIPEVGMTADQYMQRVKEMCIRDSFKPHRGRCPAGVVLLGKGRDFIQK